MGADEALFGWLWRRLRARQQTPHDSPSAAFLKAQQAELTLLATMIAGRPLSIAESGTFDEEHIVLPRCIDLLATPGENAQVYVYRAAFEATVRRLGLVVPAGTPLALRGAASLLCVRRVEAFLTAELPGAWAIRAHVTEAAVPRLTAAGGGTGGKRTQAVMRALLSGGDVRVAANLADWPLPVEGSVIAVTSELLAMATTLARDIDTQQLPVLWGFLPSPSSGAAVPSGGGSVAAEHRGRSRAVATKAHVETIESPASQLGDNPLTHSFEKVHTLEEYQGGRKSMDGEDDLDAQSDAIDELNLDHTIRTNAASQAYFESDALVGSESAAEADRVRSKSAVQYDEWDERKRVYRAGWCSVFADTAAPTAPRKEWTLDILRKRARDIDRIRGIFAALEQERRLRFRQLEGAELDIDAIVDRYADLKSGHTPEPRLYGSRRPALPELAVQLLIDSSASTDGWVQNRRVIDVAKESTMILAAALQGLDIRFHVAAFFSHTRSDCRFLHLRHEGDHLLTVGDRLVGLEPTGYTRIGPALRHATTLLSNERPRRRLLLLLSDGKPTDHDHYEGRYGRGDVSQCVREARAVGVTVFALAIDAREHPNLARMFGTDRYSVLPSPEALPLLMTKVVSQMLR